MSETPGSAPTDEPEAENGWKAVDSAESRHVPPLPKSVVFGGLGVLALLIVGAILAGVGLGGGFARPTPTPSVSPTPQLTMEPPIQVGNYVRGELKPFDGMLAQADYTDGTAKVILLMRWPQADAASFLSDAGFTDNATPSTLPSPTNGSESPASPEPPEIVCGTSTEFSQTETIGCGSVERETGLMVVGLSDQDEEEIRSLLQEFEQSVTQ